MLLLLFILSLIFPSHVLADSSNTITVSPSIVRLDLAVDKPETVLTYKNASSNTIEISLSASDVAELEYGYKPSFLDQKTAENYKYTLSSWITFDKTTLIIAPNSTENVTVFIEKDKLTPGGHYGSIMAKITNNGTDEAVEIQGVLSSLIFVRTNTGKEKESGELQSLIPNRKFLSFPKTFTLSFKNTGDTDLIPYGIIEIRDMFGRNVAKGILNDGSLTTLPESIRKYEIEIKPNNFLFPSIYTADFSGHFGKTDQKMEKHLKFLSEGNLPLILVTTVFILIFLFFARKTITGKN